MSFLSYDEVRPWAPVIMYRTAIRDRMGAMPPWYIEKDIGISDGFESDYSLSDLDLAMIRHGLKMELLEEISKRTASVRCDRG